MEKRFHRTTTGVKSSLLLTGHGRCSSVAMKKRQHLQIDWDKLIWPAKSPTPDEEEFGEDAEKIKKWLALADRMLGKSGQKKPPPD